MKREQQKKKPAFTSHLFLFYDEILLHSHLTLYYRLVNIEEIPQFFIIIIHTRIKHMIRIEMEEFLLHKKEYHQ